MRLVFWCPAAACRVSSKRTFYLLYCYVLAPTPRSKANRVLKTAISPVNMKSLPGSVGEPEKNEILVSRTPKAQIAHADAFVAFEDQERISVTGAPPEAGSSTS